MLARLRRGLGRRVRGGRRAGRGGRGRAGCTAAANRRGGSVATRRVRDADGRGRVPLVLTAAMRVHVADAEHDRGRLGAGGAHRHQLGVEQLGQAGRELRRPSARHEDADRAVDRRRERRRGHRSTARGPARGARPPRRRAPRRRRARRARPSRCDRLRRTRACRRADRRSTRVRRRAALGSSFDSSDRIASSGRCSRRNGRIRSSAWRSPSAPVPPAARSCSNNVAGAARGLGRERVVVHRGLRLRLRPVRARAAVSPLGAARPRRPASRASRRRRPGGRGTCRRRGRAAAGSSARQPVGRLFEPQVERGRDAAHVADLEVEHDEIGLLVGDGPPHVLATGHFDNTLVGADERGAYLVAHPLRIGGNAGSSWPSISSSWTLAEQYLPDLVERLEVVHVTREIRHEHHVGRAHALA